ncbi:MAG: thioredoxin-disulfide reductase [Candidatus Omnitrophota bacterium]
MYDTIIIGAGPAGLTAGLYAGRGRLNTLILERMTAGGQVMLTQSLENFPGFPGEVKADELIERMTHQVRDLGVEIRNAAVQRISAAENFTLLDEDNHDFTSRSLIIASGALPRELGVEGEKKLTGRGVSYCAVCDGPLFRDKDIAVVGGGDRAVEEATYLSRFAKSITLIHRRDALRATKILQEHLLHNPKISVVWDSVVTAMEGENYLSGLKLKNVKNGEESFLKCLGVFVAIGVNPNTHFLKGIVHTDAQGYILTDENLMTSQPGIFACGDCRKRPLLQVITACAEGALAAFSANRFLELN